jgi:hypothetical protein
VKAIEVFKGGNNAMLEIFGTLYFGGRACTGSAATLSARDWDDGYDLNRDLRHDYRDLHTIPGALMR